MDRYPYQRFLEQLCREGRDPDDIRQTLHGCGYAKIPPREFVADLISSLDGSKNDELFNSEELRIALPLIRKKSAFDYVRRAHRLDDDELIALVKHKFNIIVTDEALNAFKQAFWDLESLSHMDAVQYFSENKEAKSPRDEVPIRDAPNFHAYQDGEKVELDPEKIYEELQADAYFKYKSYLDRATPSSQQEARRWAEFLMKTLKEHRGSKPPALQGDGLDKTPEEVELQYDDGEDVDVPLISDVPQPEEGAQ